MAILQLIRVVLLVMSGFLKVAYVGVSYENVLLFMCRKNVNVVVLCNFKLVFVCHRSYAQKWSMSLTICWV